MPLLDIAAEPVAGMVALGLMLATLTARWQFPRRVSRGAWGAVVVGCLVYYAMHWLGWGPGLGGEGIDAVAGVAGRPAVAGRGLAGAGSRGSWSEAISYLPVAIPLALATVVGGIDCTESAAAAGDDYPTGQIIAAEGFATLVGGLFGGVIQSTPYIGHPAYKAMGARSAYTLATAIFVGAAGIFGYFDWIFFLIPKAVIFPILIFVGLEITAQSFHATPVRHYPAVAFACVPALAYLALLALNQIMPELGKPFAELPPPTQHWIQTVTVLAGGGGFIVTSLLWGTALAHMIDGRVRPLVPTLAAGGRLFLVRRHSFALAVEPDHDPRRRDPPAGSRGTSQGVGSADALSLVGRLCSDGRWRSLALDRFGTPPAPSEMESPAPSIDGSSRWP